MNNAGPYVTDKQLTVIYAIAVSQIGNQLAIPEASRSTSPDAYMR